MSNDIRRTLSPFATRVGRSDRKPEAVKVAEANDIHIKAGKQELYNDGTRSVSVDIWGYTADPNAAVTTPGPSVEVDTSDPGSPEDFTVEWFNHIPAGEIMPTEVAVTNGPDQAYLHNVVGRRASDVEGAGNRAQGFTVAHFHGGKTSAPHDGWPETMLHPHGVDAGPNRHRGRYRVDQRAGLYWYHDHAMHTTRLNVYSGLAGFWIIRDQLEKDIGLWDADTTGTYGRNDELVLVLQDRNLSGAYEGGAFVPDGKLLHRVESGYRIDADGMAQPAGRVPEEGESEEAGTPLEFYGPLTVVNGKLWPTYTRIDAGLYRVRLLNGSNARVYRLHLLQVDRVNNTYVDRSELVTQIGTDMGLLPEAVALPYGRLTLAPAERADLLIDFTADPDSEFILINSAESPFGGVPIDDPDPGATIAQALAEAQARLVSPSGEWPAGYDPEKVEDRNPYPEVLKFEVGKRATNHPDTTTLNQIKANMTAKSRPVFEHERDLITKNPSVGPVRTVILAERAMNDGTAMLVHMELAPVSVMNQRDGQAPLSATRQIMVNGEDTRVVAERFQDPVSFVAALGSTETWRFINVSADTHPMHVHLVHFLVNRRVPVTVDYVDGSNPDSPISTITWDDATSVPPEANETGFKDTVRVNPGEMVEIQMRFDGYCGRYVYHCHLLEHEDHDMMRQFVVTRNDTGHHHGWSVGISPELPKPQ